MKCDENLSNNMTLLSCICTSFIYFYLLLGNKEDSVQLSVFIYLLGSESLK